MDEAVDAFLEQRRQQSQQPDGKDTLLVYWTYRPDQDMFLFVARAATRLPAEGVSERQDRLAGEMAGMYSGELGGA